MISKIRLGTFRQYSAALIANFGIFGIGTVIGWTSPVIPQIEDEMELTTLEKSWIGSIVNLGALLACLVGGVLLDKLGRKATMLLFTVPFLGGWILVIFVQNIAMMYAGRFILGFAALFYGISGPVFTGEIAHPENRGILANMYAVGLTLGILFSYCVGAVVNWQVLSIISSAIPIILFFLLLWIPESPRHLIITGKRKEGIESLKWYRGVVNEENDETISKELCEIEKSLIDMTTNKKGTVIQDCFGPGARQPLLTMIAMVIIEQFSGFVAIVAYTAHIFNAAGFETSNTLTIIFGVAQFLAVIPSSLLIERVGRRALLIFGQTFIVISLGSLGAYFYAENLNEGHTLEGFSWVPLTCLVVYIVAFFIGIGSVSSTLMGELLPQNIRSIGTAICTFVLRVVAFLVSLGFKPVAEEIGTHWCFWTFTAFGIFGLIFVIIWVPETKGKSLEDIRAYYMSKV